MIKVKINGKETELNSTSTIKDMLNFINYQGKMFVIEKNLEIVPKEEYETCKLSDGDVVEIVAFAGGG